MRAQMGTQASVRPLNKGHRQGQSDESEEERSVDFWIQLHCDFRSRLSKENRRGRSPGSTCPSAQKRRSANPLLQETDGRASQRRCQLLVRHLLEARQVREGASADPRGERPSAPPAPTTSETDGEQCKRCWVTVVALLWRRNPRIGRSTYLGLTYYILDTAVLHLLFLD